MWHTSVAVPLSTPTAHPKLPPAYSLVGFWANKSGWCWFIVRGKHCWLADKPWLKPTSEQAARGVPHQQNYYTGMYTWRATLAKMMLTISGSNSVDVTLKLINGEVSSMRMAIR